MKMKSNHLKWLIPLALCLAILVGAGIWAMNSFFVMAGGQLIPRSVRNLDLRESELTLQDYRSLHEELPECSILWNVPFQGSSYPSNSRSLRISSLSDEDVAALDYFPQLELLDASGCTDYAALEAFAARRPDCEVIYQVNVLDQAVPRDTKTLRVEDPSMDSLPDQLSLLSELTYLELGGDLPAAELNALQAEYPGISVRWEVTFQNETYLSDITHLDLSSRILDYAEVEAFLSWLPVLETADLRGSSLTDEEMILLADTYPQTFFIWEMEVAGLRFSTDSREIDISGQTVTDPATIEAVLPYFHNLERVIMSDCGLDNETMDALNNRYEDIRFIWTVYIRWYPFRTDAKYFYPYKLDPNRFPQRDAFTNSEVAVLRYCIDMESIDFGHMANIDNIEWAAYMPNLKYLIITDCAVLDLTPLENCKELVYFEATNCSPKLDLTPLVNCTKLENVNLGWTYCSPTGLDQMPWLHHVWWNCIKGQTGMPCANAEEILRAALPNTVFMFDGAHPVDQGWRELQTYGDMRDLMDMFYLR